MDIDLLVNVFGKTLDYVSVIIVALLVLILGWLIALVIKILISKLLDTFQFNKLCDRLKITEFLDKGDVAYTPSKLVSVIFYWIILIIVFFISAHMLGLGRLDVLLTRLLDYIPNVIVAILIIIIGTLISVFIGNIVRTIASNANVPEAEFLGKATKVLIIIFVIFMALEQLQIALDIVKFSFKILFGGIVFGLSLAFAIGCNDIVKDFVQQILQRNSHRRKKGPRPPDLEE